MLLAIKKCVTPAPDSKCWKRGEDGGQFWRAPLTPHTSVLSCATEPSGGVRREQDRADVFCNFKAEPGWLTTELCCFDLVCVWFFFSLKKIIYFF